MAAELTEQIKAVEAEIAKAVREIEVVAEQLEPIVARLLAVDLPAELRADLRAERDRLGKREKLLGRREQQLRADKDLLLKAALPPGAARCFPSRLFGRVPAWRHCLLRSQQQMRRRRRRSNKLGAGLCIIAPKALCGGNKAQNTASSK